MSTEVAEVLALLSEASVAEGPVSPGVPVSPGLAPAAPPTGSRTAVTSDDGDHLARALAALSSPELDDASRINVALSASVARCAGRARLATDLTLSVPAPIWVDRPRAAVGAWYELFPRSFGGFAGRLRARSRGWPNSVSTSFTSRPSTPSGTRSAKERIIRS